MADSLLKEVDDALRADRAAGLWNKHKGSIIALVAALILGTAINSGWQQYRQAQGGKTLLALTKNQELLKAGKAEDAAKGFAEVAASAEGDLQALAQVWQARALIAAEKKDEAIAVLKTASAGTSLWADIACMRLAGLDAKAATCLSAAAASPLAGERAQWAAATAWGNGDRDAALAALEKLIADENTSQEARAQLLQWQATMKAEKGEK